MPVAYFMFGGPIDRVQLPAPLETTRDDATVQMLALGAGCGERVPVVVRHQLATDRYLKPGVLTVRPVPGFVLRPVAMRWPRCCA